MALKDSIRVREVEGIRHPDPYGDPRLETDSLVTVLRYDVAIAEGGGRATLSFDLAYATHFGWPNDESLNGHRLYGNGLKPYAVQEVIPSDWVAEMESRNRSHPGHAASIFEGLRHIIIPFKDNTFECVFQDLSITYDNGDQP